MKASIYRGLPIADYRRVPVFFMSKLAHGYPGYHEASQPHRNCKSGACQHSVAQNEYSRVERALFKCDGTFANIKELGQSQAKYVRFVGNPWAWRNQAISMRIARRDAAKSEKPWSSDGKALYQACFCQFKMWGGLIGFNTKSWSNDMDDLGYPHSRKQPCKLLVLGFMKKFRMALFLTCSFIIVSSQPNRPQVGLDPCCSRTLTRAQERSG